MRFNKQPCGCMPVVFLYFLFLYPEAEATANVSGIDDKAFASSDVISTTEILQKDISLAPLDKISSNGADYVKPTYPTEGIAVNDLETTEAAIEMTEKIDLDLSSSTHPTVITELTKEGAPEQTLAVYNSKGKICLLAKFTVIININKSGEEASFNMPDNVISRGKCGGNIKSPLLHLSWDEFDFFLTFSKVSNDKNSTNWAVTSLELRYDTSAPFFGGTNIGKITARSKNIEIFKTEIGKSFYCPKTEVISLYSSNKKVATIKMKDIQLQPFDVKGGNFSSVQRCNYDFIGGPEEPFFQDETDETVPLAVGLTFSILTLIAVIGFSVHRSYTMRKVDYNSME